MHNHQRQLQPTHPDTQTVAWSDYLVQGCGVSAFFGHHRSEESESGGKQDLRFLTDDWDLLSGQSPVWLTPQLHAVRHWGGDGPAT